MGCDIHMVAEIKRSFPNQRVEPRWEMVGRVFDAPYYRQGDPVTIHRYGGDGDGEAYEYDDNDILCEYPYGQRNYDVFAMLAGVRNGSGFAGVDTGDGFKPIAEPRGWPDDMTDAARHRMSNEHTPSWLSLAEIEAYDWTQATTKRGLVYAGEYRDFKANGRPTSWCGGIWSNLAVFVSNEEMDTMLANEATEWNGKTPYTQVEWRVTYAEAARSFYSETLPKLRQIAAWEYVQDVRIVFDFDS